MRNAISAIFILSFTFSIAYSQVTQEWGARFNREYEHPHSMAVDDSGNVYVTGESSIAENSDFATVKYNSSGMQQWIAIYNGQGDTTDVAFSIVVDRDYNVYVAGRSYGEISNYDIVVIKYNSSGQQLWLRIYDSGFNLYDSAEFMTIDDSSNIYIAGYSGGTNIIIKYNSSGVLQWVSQHSVIGSFSMIISSFALDKLRNVYITGYTEGSGSEIDFMTIKYDSLGLLKWIRRYNGPHNSEDLSNSLTLDTLGNIYVTGECYRQVGFLSDCVTIKYDSNGNQQWASIYNRSSSSLNGGFSVKQDFSGNVYVAAQSIALSNDYVVIKYNSQGMEQWAAIYGDNYNDLVNYMEIDNYGYVYVTGSSENSRGLSFGYLTLKYNSSGVLQWTKRYEGSFGLDFPRALALDSYRNVYVTGYSYAKETGHDYFTIKYSQSIGIESISSEIPSNYSVSQNYPNPFNPVTNIRFQIPKPGFAEVKIFDMLGKEAVTLVSEQLNPGTYEVQWNAANYSSGVYYYKLVTAEFTETKKMILIK